MVQPKNRRIASEAYADTAWTKGIPTDPINADTYQIPGSIHLSGPAATASTGLPRAEPCDFDHLTDPGYPAWGTQVATYYGTNPERYWRVSRNTAGLWNAWQRIPVLADVEAVNPAKGNPAAINADTHTAVGFYHLGGPNATNSTGLPRAEPCDFVHFTDPSNPTWGSQMAIYYGTNPQMWWRVSRTTGGVMNAWQRVPTMSDIPDGNTASAGLTNQLRVEEWWGRTGGEVNTGGKAALSFRFDHGLTNLKAHLVPEMVSRGFKWVSAINSRTIGNAANGGASIADITGWVNNYGAEIANHGATHDDNPDVEDEIVGGLNELKTLFPGIPIDMYIPAGVGGTNLGGFDQSDPASYATSKAGQLILANHAIGAGFFPNTTSGGRLIDGKPRQGQGHYTIDTQTVAAIKARIDAAIANKRGLQIMLHPEYLGQPNNITVSQVIEVLDYVKAKETAGDLVVLSATELIRANAGS